MAFEGIVGEWMKRRRKELDLTQAELGDLIGCSSEYIRKIEQGTRRPSKVVAILLADTLHLPIDERSQFIDALRKVEHGVEQTANKSIDHYPSILIILAGFVGLAIHAGRLEQAAILVGYVQQHFKPIHNTVFSLQHVELDLLVNKLKVQWNTEKLKALLTVGGQMTYLEAITLALKSI